MKTKPKIKEKLEEAKNLHEKALGDHKAKLNSVIDTLRWVLDQKITQEPKNPVA